MESERDLATIARVNNVSTKSYMRSTYEIRDNEECDLTTTMGFICLIFKVLRIREGGLLYGGPPCSLMVWIAKYVHKRTRAMPWGDEQWSCAWPYHEHKLSLLHLHGWCALRLGWCALRLLKAAQVYRNRTWSIRDSVWYCSWAWHGMSIRPSNSP